MLPTYPVVVGTRNMLLALCGAYETMTLVLGAEVELMMLEEFVNVGKLVDA